MKCVIQYLAKGFEWRTAPIQTNTIVVIILQNANAQRAGIV